MPSSLGQVQAWPVRLRVCACVRAPARVWWLPPAGACMEAWAATSHRAAGPLPHHCGASSSAADAVDTPAQNSNSSHVVRLAASL